MATISNNEITNIKKYIKPKDIVFDVGACIGEWSDAVLQVCPDVNIHQFEPVPQAFIQLKNESLFRNKFALSNKVGQIEFYHYPSQPMLSTEFRRSSKVEHLFSLVPDKIIVNTTTIDAYCIEHQIHKINFLKIDVEGNEFAVLEGAEEMLQAGNIDYIQFEYGACFYDAGISFQQVWELLTSYGFKVFDETRLISNWTDFTTNIYIITGDCLAIKQ